MEKKQASPELKVFFEKLLGLKYFVKFSNEKCEEDPNYGHDYGPVIISAIYHALDAIIKEKK